MLTRIDCPNCYSVNRVRIEPFNFAYECWNCYARTWLDDDSKEACKLLYGFNDIEAYHALQEGQPFFAMGEIYE